MIDVDTDVVLALAKPDDWLGERTRALVREHVGELRTSLAMFIELFLVLDRYDVDRRRAASAALQIASVPEDAVDVVFQAIVYIEEGATVLDAFHGALAGTDPILSGDGIYDDLGLARIPLEAGRA